MLEHQTHFLLSLTPSFEQATPHANRMVIQVQTAECAMWGSEREKKKHQVQCPEVILSVFTLITFSCGGLCVLDI